MVLSDPGEHDDCPVDNDIVLSKLDLCSNKSNFDVSGFFAIHGVDFGGALPTCDDVASRFVDGQCASRNVPGCCEVARANRSLVEGH